jgi:hypothetical protein
MHKHYNEWMSESVRELTPAGKIKRPSYETAVDWVNQSWNAVDVNLIRRSFKCCGISNKRDGTEDDWIFDYRRLEQRKSNDEVTLDDENNEDNEYEDGDVDSDYYNEGEENYNNDWN